MLPFRTMVMAVAAAGLLSFFATASLSAAPRVALVIGNASYAHAPALANPLNDAADMGAALERLGFEVTRLENVGDGEMRRGLNEFRRAASASEVAVVFYAGHGIEVDGRNFLVPVDARLATDQDVEYEAIPLELAQRAVERASGLRLVILDACRENPFAVSMQRAGATRSIGRGLARVEPSGETLVAYAAKEGTVASDGDGRNSPYSEALLRFLEEPNLEVMFMLRKVRDAVLASTGGSQEPFWYGSLSSKGVYLAAGPEPEPAPSQRQSTADGSGSPRVVAERELLFWESVKDSEHPVDIRLYLDRYPGGIYEGLARNRLERLRDRLKDAETATAEDVVAPTPNEASVAARLEAERLAEEREFWASVRGSVDRADLQAYLDRYPDGAYAVLARNRLKRLDGATAPPAPQETVTPSSQETSPAHDAPLASLPPPESVEKALGLTRAQRVLVQRVLSASKFDTGPADGAFGPRTRAAIGKWQASRGEPVTRYLDAEAAKTLLSAGEAAPSSHKRRKKLLQEANDLLSKAQEAAARSESKGYVAWAYSEIAKTQAEAGDVQGALVTAQQIEKGHHRNNAFRGIAPTQAKAGDIQAALAIVARIDGYDARAGALSSIAFVQSEAGDKRGAARSFSKALTAVQKIGEFDDRYFRLSLVARMMARTGHGRDATRAISDVLANTHRMKREHTRNLTLSNVAKVQAYAGDFQGALRTVARIDDGERSRVEALAVVAEAQAKAGDKRGAARSFSKALAAAPGVYGYRDFAFSSIARAQASSGDFRGALGTVQRIAEESTRAYALHDIAEAQAKGGDKQAAARSFFEASATVQKIEDHDDRALAFAWLAQAQVRTDDDRGAERTISEALTASQEILQEDNYARALAHIARALVRVANHGRRTHRP